VNGACRKRADFYVKYQLFLSSYDQTCNMLSYFSKTPTMEFHRNVLNDCQDITADRLMAKWTVTFL
jgi:hypothetical protein